MSTSKPSTFAPTAPRDSSASERINGSLGGRAGTFELEHRGTFDGKTARTWAAETKMSGQSTIRPPTVT